MKDLNILHIVLIYLAVINVVTFFMYGIDKWKAKKSKWRIRETALLGLAVLGGSAGADYIINSIDELIEITNR